ncbi:MULTISPECIES: maleylpyruvate isomerase family mycothiol-dependent enzyme [Streptomyces]|uniref:maleylpyruvate isomerase family mycothiol-dependent enzyme n=1 Tax=Streptomyces TaxID=1883 RepID=UPI000381F605|nr:MULTISPECIES: maleylpyruvate isomerase family mycothiol-dependent enzyme [Streptomyces]MBE8477374.1 maleylpyruvate isomerase family mycothiol-dependent enzyme [Streptomyces justiciae]
MSDVDVVINALRVGHDSLAAVVRGFDEDDLSRRSGASDWDVSQVLGHLGSGAEIARSVILAALDGCVGLGDGFNFAVWDRWNAMSRQVRARSFLRANESLVALYESLDVGTRARLRVDLGFLTEPFDVVAGTARLRLSEFTLHSWDVRVAFDEHATLDPAATAILLHGKPNLLPWISETEGLKGLRAVIQVNTTDPASTFALRLQAPVSVDFDVPDRPDGTLTLPAEAWVRLVAGRLTPRNSPAGVESAGAADLGLLRAVFPGY